ncbi:MAG TPA: YaaC family protein [Candidatus Baltobacteraceae bacterium]|nr:YaaC family protein [Candidatus Baltobacteraceae bacterium]
MNSLNRLREVWPLDERRSRAPHSALWHELSRFAGRDAAEVLFREPHADAKFLKPFLNAVTLADDNVKAWEDVDDDFTAAVLLYYGTLWLGNAVAFTTLSGEQLSKREAAHGLEVAFEFRSSSPLLEARINTGRGTQAFGTINAAFGGASLSGQTFQVRDFLEAIPELRHSLPHARLRPRVIEAVWTGDVPGDDYLDEALRSFPNIEVDIQDHVPSGPGWIRDNIAVGAYLIEQGGSDAIFVDNRITWDRASVNGSVRSPEDELLATTIVHDGRRFFLPTIKQTAISEYAIYLAVMYAISVAARYSPDYWIEMQRERTVEYFLVREFLELAEDKVPMLALNHLRRTTFIFNSL